MASGIGRRASSVGRRAGSDAYPIGTKGSGAKSSAPPRWTYDCTLADRSGHQSRGPEADTENLDDDEHLPELLTDATIELLLRGAKALVIVVNVVVLITFAILTLGFFLHLAGASSEASFVDWVYRNTERAMQPFRGMFPIQDIDGRSVFDASLLFAAALYGFVAIGLHALVVYLSARVRRFHHRAERAARLEAAARRSSHAAAPVAQGSPTPAMPGPAEGRHQATPPVAGRTSEHPATAPRAGSATAPEGGVEPERPRLRAGSSPSDRNQSATARSSARRLRRSLAPFSHLAANRHRSRDQRPFSTAGYRVTLTSRTERRHTVTSTSDIRTVGDLMTGDLIALRTVDTVDRARQVISDYGLHALPVLDEDRAVGVVTLADCENHLNYEQLGDVCVHPPVTIDVGASVAAAAELMRTEHIHTHLLVTDGRSGEVIGILSSFDLLYALMV